MFYAKKQIFETSEEQNFCYSQHVRLEKKNISETYTKSMCTTLDIHTRKEAKMAKVPINSQIPGFQTSSRILQECHGTNRRPIHRPLQEQTALESLSCNYQPRNSDLPCRRIHLTGSLAGDAKSVLLYLCTCSLVSRMDANLLHQGIGDTTWAEYVQPRGCL